MTIDYNHLSKCIKIIIQNIIKIYLNKKIYNKNYILLINVKIFLN